MPEEIHVAPTPPAAPADSGPAEPSSEELAAQLGLTRREADPEPAPAAQPQAQKPGEPAQMPPAKPQADPEALKTLRAEIERDNERIIQERVRREMGQFRKSQADQQRIQAEDTKRRQPPASWAGMTPEQQAAYSEAFDHYFQEKFGPRLAQLEQSTQAFEFQRQNMAVASQVQQLAGEQWGELEPIVTQIYQEADRKSAEGDEDSKLLLDEFHQTRAGKAYVLQMARQRLSDQLKEQGKMAEQAKAAQATKASTAVGSTAAPVTVALSADSLPKGNGAAARAERLKTLEASGLV